MLLVWVDGATATVDSKFVLILACLLGLGMSTFDKDISIIDFI
jgi:hypothetical protein